MSEQRFDFSGWMNLMSSELVTASEEFSNLLSQENIVSAFATVTVLTADGKVHRREIAINEQATDLSTIGGRTAFDFTGSPEQARNMYNWMTETEGLSVLEDDGEVKQLTLYRGDPSHDDSIYIEYSTDGSTTTYGI